MHRIPRMLVIEEDLFNALNSFFWNNIYIIIYCNEDVFHLVVCPPICRLLRCLVFKQFIHGVARSASSNTLYSRLFELNLDPVDLVVHSDDEEVDGLVSLLNCGSYNYFQLHIQLSLLKVQRKHSTNLSQFQEPHEEAPDGGQPAHLMRRQRINNIEYPSQYDWHLLAIAPMFDTLDQRSRPLRNELFCDRWSTCDASI